MTFDVFDFWVEQIKNYPEEVIGARVMGGRLGSVVALLILKKQKQNQS